MKRSYKSIPLLLLALLFCVVVSANSDSLLAGIDDFGVGRRGGDLAEVTWLDGVAEDDSHGERQLSLAFAAIERTSLADKLQVTPGRNCSVTTAGGYCGRDCVDTLPSLSYIS